MRLQKLLTAGGAEIHINPDNVTIVHAKVVDRTLAGLPKTTEVHVEFLGGEVIPLHFSQKLDDVVLWLTTAPEDR